MFLKPKNIFAFKTKMTVCYLVKIFCVMTD